MDDGKLKMNKIGLPDQCATEAAKSSLADLVVFDDNAQGLAPREQGFAPMSQIITGNCWMTNCQTCATNARGHVPSMQRYGWVVYRIWNHDIALKQSNVTDEFVLWPCYFKCLLDMTYETQFWYSIQVKVAVFCWAFLAPAILPFKKGLFATLLPWQTKLGSEPLGPLQVESMRFDFQVHHLDSCTFTW